MATFIGENRLKELLILIKNRFISSAQVDGKISTAIEPLAKKTDVPKVSDTYSATSKDAMSGVAVASAVASVKVDISKESDNAIEQKTDGLYVKKVSGGASSWDEVSDKPFSTIDKNTLAVNDGELTVIGGGGGGNLEAYLINSDYSEKEFCIGEYNGKPLYRKVIKSTTPNAVSDRQVVASLSALGMDALSNVYYFFTNSLGQYISNNINVSRIFVENQNILMEVDYASGVSKELSIIIEYTKATDAENSFDPSMITKNFRLASAPNYDIYSEDEVVIGRYIDGRPIYRKVFKGVMPTPPSDYTMINSYFGNIADISWVIKVEATFRYNESGTYHPLTWVGVSGTNISYAEVRVNANQINVYNNRTIYGDKPVVVIVEYTKTTDAPNSFKPEMIKSDTLIDEVQESQVDYIIDKLKGGN